MPAGEASYPERWETDVVLSDGGTVHVRPLVPTDAPAIQAFHGRQSRESVYFRYFTPMPKLTDRELERITAVDYMTHMAFVALLGDDIIGMASYDVWSGRNEAEVAFFVDDEHHGRGLATVLLEYLVVAARENGIDALTAQVLPTNRSMIAVFRQVGFEVSSRYENGIVEVRLELEPTERSATLIEERERRAEARSIERILFPSSIAVIGAGRDPEGLGARVVRNLVVHGFDGAIYPVNPQAATVEGLEGHASVLDVGQDIDLAVVVVPAAAIPDVVEECGRKRVHGLVVISAGLDEVEIDGEPVERFLVRRAHRVGMRVIGPESLGVVNTARDGCVHATFAEVEVTAGPVGFLTQSGTLGVAALEHARRVGVGVSSFVDIGKRVDVSGNDLLQFWRDDERTSVVLLYLETFGNPRKFTRIARAMARTKPIVAVKTAGAFPAERADSIGRSVAAWPAEATTEALLAQSGVIRVDTPPEMFAVARVLLCQPVPEGRRVAVVSNSNGATRLATDACGRAGLQVTRVSSMTWTATPDDYDRSVRGALLADDVDSIVMVYAPPMRARRDEVGRAVVRVLDEHATAGGRQKPLVATILGDVTMTSFRGDAVATLPLFEFPGDAARVLGLITDYGEWRSQPEGQTVELSAESLGAIRELVASVLEPDPKGRWLDRDAAADLLHKAGFHVASHRTIDDVDGAARAGDELGYPVVLKATGIERVHPGEQGGVALDLHDELQLRAAYERMCSQLGDAMRPAVVQAMVRPGTDVLVGAHQHPSFGGTLSVGIGGAMAAANPELPTRILPVTDVDADRLVASSPVAAPLALEGDGASSVCASFLARLGAVLEQVPEVADVVISPLIVRADRADVVDAFIRLAPYDWDPMPDVRRLD